MGFDGGDGHVVGEVPFFFRFHFVLVQWTVRSHMLLGVRVRDICVPCLMLWWGWLGSSGLDSRQCSTVSAIQSGCCMTRCWPQWVVRVPVVVIHCVGLVFMVCVSLVGVGGGV